MVGEQRDPKRQILFFACTAVTICLVLVGWFFSFRDQWRVFNSSFSSSFDQVSEVKNSVQGVADDLRADLVEPGNEVGSVVQTVTNELQTAADQRTQAQNTVGNIMKDNIDNQYGETQENSQTPNE